MAQPTPYDDDDEDNPYEDPFLAASSEERPSDDPTTQAWARAGAESTLVPITKPDMRTAVGGVSAGPRSVLEGWVMKEGSEWLSWRRRYLVLREASPVDAKAHGCTHTLLWFSEVPVRGEAK
jgi:hypothetical protein